MNNKIYKVMIPDAMYSNPDIEEVVLRDRAKVILHNATKVSDISDSDWQSCDAVIVYDNLRYDKYLLDKLQQCKIIARAGIGYDIIDLEEAKKKGIIVCNVPDYCVEEVADHTIALLLALVRNIVDFSEDVRDHKWPRTSTLTFRLKGKTMGIIGFGRIGMLTALRAKSFGLNIVFYDPYLREGYDKVLDVKRCYSLKEIAELSDIVSVHTPLTDETYNLIDDNFFSFLKKEIILLNTARGGIINISALFKAMKESKVLACGVDVLPQEPLDKTVPLLKDYINNEKWIKGRLIVTPHTAFYSHEALKELRKKASEEVLRVLNNKPGRNCVNNFYV